jgi:hypothetical protein
MLVLAAHRLMPPVLALLMSALISATALGQDAPASVDDSNARRIVEEADRIRLPAEAFQVDVAIVTTGDDKAPDERKYRVLSKGSENTVVMVTEPASGARPDPADEGARAVGVPAERLAAGAPVAIAAAHRTGRERRPRSRQFRRRLQPAHSAHRDDRGEKYNVLELVAVDRSVTYQRVVYWVREANSAPHKAEFYSLSNRLLKTCTYENYEKMAGKLRPTRLVMEDPLHVGDRSVLEYGAMKLRDIPDKVFTKDYLKKLE